jgi:hypothetical protein
MTEHLDSVSLARYLGGAGTTGERARWETHLSECPDCREELVEARRIVATAPGRRRRALVPLAAAAAVLLLVWTGTVDREPLGRVARDPETSPALALAPRPVAPLGAVSRADHLLWTRVPGALRYRVTLFTSDGQAAWQTTTADTFATLPDTIPLALAVPHYWQVKAEIGFGRWVESELVAFTMARTDAPR